MVTPGNPESVKFLSWEFLPKYAGEFYQSEQQKFGDTDIIISKSIYTDAGIYKCIVGNTVGNKTAEAEIVVHCKFFKAFH